MSTTATIEGGAVVVRGENYVNHHARDCACALCVAMRDLAALRVAVREYVAAMDEAQAQRIRDNHCDPMWIMVRESVAFAKLRELSR